MNSLARCVLLCCMASLTACYSGPSDSDVESAMKARVNEMGSDEESLKVTAAKNMGCGSRDSDGAYTCTVEVEMALMGGHTKSVGELKMVEEDGVWTYDKKETMSLRPADAP